MILRRIENLIIKITDVLSRTTTIAASNLTIREEVNPQ